MEIIERPGAGFAWCLVLLFGAAASGCSDGRNRTPGLNDGIGPAPTVTTVTPADEAVDVALDITFVSADFSVPMAPVTADTTFTLTCVAPCTGPTGTVALDASGLQAVFTLTPAFELESLTLYTATLSGFRSSDNGVALTNPFVWSFTTALAPDTTAPRVSSTSPRADDSNVAFNSLIAVSFSEPMDPLTISTGTIGLACPAGLPVAGTVSFAAIGNVATFAPTSDLPPSSNCTVTVSTGAKDAAGNGMVDEFSWNFATGDAPDVTAPLVSSTSPPPDAIDVATNALITASFSESMDPLTFFSDRFTLACPAGTPIPGLVGYAVSGSVATFAQAGDLPAGTICLAQVDGDVTDVAGNAIAGSHSWSFTTAFLPDITLPAVSATSPSSGDSGVAINSLITVSFSEPMDPLTITTASFELACPAGTAIVATVDYVDGDLATLTPAGDLPAGTVCAVTITTGVEDVAGNALAGPFEWTFTTGAAPDTTAPTVISTNPLPDETGVATSSYVTVNFSEPMDPLTITQTSFTLACPAGTAIASTVGYAVNSSDPILMPADELPASTTCTATISTAAEDVAHNALAAAHDWSFTTGLAPDTTAPLVESTNPADNAVGVCINKSINATFSEAMDPLTITTATFTLDVMPSGSVAGVVTYDAQTHIATFIPSADLTGTPATEHIATILGGPEGVRDLAGNALLQDEVTTFTTNASTCTTAPALGAASPFGGFGGNATLTNDGLETRINGDIGVNAASTTITGLRDSSDNLYTVTLNNDGFVNGLVYSLTAPPGSVPGDTVTQARAAALAAFNSLSPANLPGGIDMANPVQCPSCGGAGDGAGELAGRTLPPGVYLSATGTFDLGGAGHAPGNLTLDAGGDANAVWVFQTTALTGTLNVGLTGPAPPAVPIQVLLINGAQPGNVFWYVPAGAVIGTGSTLAGTVLANAAITISTTGGTPPMAPITIINGRVISLVAGVTITNAVINVPAP